MYTSGCLSWLRSSKVQLNKLGFMSWGHLSVSSQLWEGLAAVLVRPAGYLSVILLMQTEFYELVYWKTEINGSGVKNRHELDLMFVMVISWLLLVSIVMGNVNTEESERNQLIFPILRNWCGKIRRKNENGVPGFRSFKCCMPAWSYTPDMLSHFAWSLL